MNCSITFLILHRTEVNSQTGLYLSCECRQGVFSLMASDLHQCFTVVIIYALASFLDCYFVISFAFAFWWGGLGLNLSSYAWWSGPFPLIWKSRDTALNPIFFLPVFSVIYLLLSIFGPSWPWFSDFKKTIQIYLPVSIITESIKVLCRGKGGKELYGIIYAVVFPFTYITHLAKNRDQWIFSQQKVVIHGAISNQNVSIKYT